MFPVPSPVVIRAVLFDFNGVLVDDEPLHLELFQGILAEQGVSLSSDLYYERYLGCDDEECLRQALAAAGHSFSESDLARLVAKKASRYQERIRAEGYPFFAGAIETLRRAAAAELMLGVVSGALRAEVEGALEEAGVRSLVKTIVAAEDVSEGKPDPEGYELAVSRLNRIPPLQDRLLHPHQVLAVEDSVAGLRAARRAGLRTAAISHMYPRKRLLPEADVVLDDLEPDAVAELLASFDGEEGVS